MLITKIEPTVFSKRYKPDRHLIKPFSSQKTSKKDNSNVIEKKTSLNENGLEI